MSGASEKILFLADVEDSTRLDQPELVYERLDAVCREMNEHYSPSIALQRQYGDEVAGLFTAAEPLYEVVSALREAAYPKTEIRFVAVRGKIGVMDEDISKVGGEVFKRASALIEEVKTKGGFGRFAINESVDTSLTAMIQISDYVIGSMTKRQRMVYKLLAQGRTHEQIAQQFKVSRQAVTDAAKRGGAQFVIEAECAIREVLSKL